MNGIPDLREIQERLNSGAVDEVIGELQEAVGHFPSYVAARVQLALALEAGGREADALNEWRTAFRLCPDSPAILAGLREASSRNAMTKVDRGLDEAWLTSANTADAAGSGDVTEIDALIEELEVARIVPDPTIEPASEDDLEIDVDDVASETLARIYANQRFFVEAARVYEKLADQQPERAGEFMQKAVEIRERLGQ